VIFESSGCSWFCNNLFHLCKTVCTHNKALFWLLPLFIIFTYDQSWLYDFVEDRRKKVNTSGGVWPFILVILAVTIIKALNGPALSKSFITVSLTVLIYKWAGDLSKTWVMVLVVCSDCMFNLGISLTQLIISAPRMSGTIFFYCALYIDFVSTFHWIIFIMGFIFLASKNFADGSGRMIGYTLCFPLAIWSIWNLFQKCICLQREKTFEFQGPIGVKYTKWDQSQITEVENNSQAEKCGVKAGWRIVICSNKDAKYKGFDPVLKKILSFENADAQSVASDGILKASRDIGMEINPDTCRVEKIKPGSKAEQSNIDQGWVVTSVSGAPYSPCKLKEIE